jgi:pimeloyl-ACP methyl ester carboxylesterase
VNDLASWYSKDDLSYWQKQRVIYLPNSRTGQQMPMDYQLVEDYERHAERYDVPNAISHLAIPMLAIHGTDDQTVPVQVTEQLARWNASVRLELIEGADHTFGGTHPWQPNHLPTHMKHAADATIRFFKSVSD